MTVNRFTQPMPLAIDGAIRNDAEADEEQKHAARVQAKLDIEDLAARADVEAARVDNALDEEAYDGPANAWTRPLSASKDTASREQGPAIGSPLEAPKTRAVGQDIAPMPDAVSVSTDAWREPLASSKDRKRK